MGYLKNFVNKDSDKVEKLIFMIKTNNFDELKKHNK
jgi:hypothetical protein